MLCNHNLEGKGVNAASNMRQCEEDLGRKADASRRFLFFPFFF